MLAKWGRAGRAVLSHPPGAAWWLEVLGWDPRQGLGLYTELEEVGKGSRRRLGGCRMSQVEGNPERRGCLAIYTRNS